MACQTQVCKEEFRCGNFGLGHKQPRLFVTSQCGPSVIYPIWTILWLVYRVIWIILDIYWDAEDGDLPDSMWLVFLTNWSYLLLHIASTWDFISTHVVNLSQTNIKKGERESMPWYLMVDWILFNTLNVVGFFVTIVYYGVLTTVASPSSINKHAMNSVFIFINFFLCAKPVRILHFYQPLTFILMFGIFSLIYQLSTGFIIYPFLDWYNPGPTVGWVLGLGLGVMPLVHLFFYGLYHIRTLVHEKCCFKPNPSSVETRNTHDNTVEEKNV
ncbi:protein rolling stone-like [Mizuhopecten yessoensis]|uniref:protein rolling stone-like n=1 Tax=Mizuhopecten yessoensis TaxID=6573 RepID=UPI000B458126|nr:protein rolling stone-like [Mizuhopecten yessoensis]XP_021365046.1 protein rolling stone-like [Mizuhopecten yessoensis]